MPSIGISEDVAYTKVPGSGLNSKLTGLPPNDPEGEKLVISEIIKKLESSRNPIVMIDGGAGRYSWEAYTDELVKALQAPYFVTTIGKGAVTEDSPLYGGFYAGLASWPKVNKVVESADCILWLGNLPSDFNTYVQFYDKVAASPWLLLTSTGVCLRSRSSRLASLTSSVSRSRYVQARRQ